MGQVQRIKESKKIVPKDNISKSDPKNVEPCSKQEDLVEALLRSIEELEEDLKDKEGDLDNAKKDLDAVKTTLEGKERVLTTVQESIPKVVNEHKKALETRDNEIKELKLRNIKMQEEAENKSKNLICKDEEVNKL